MSAPRIHNSTYIPESSDTPVTTTGLTNAELRASPVPVVGELTLSGSVTVSNFPATQPVSGTFFQATQPVSGTFWQATQPVSGTFFQATQPISAASLPLPSGAATETTVAAINT